MATTLVSPGGTNVGPNYIWAFSIIPKEGKGVGPLGWGGEEVKATVLDLDL